MVEACDVEAVNLDPTLGVCFKVFVFLVRPLIIVYFVKSFNWIGGEEEVL